MDLFKIENSKEDAIQIIVDGINSYNREQVAVTIAENWTHLNYIAKNNQSEVIGGILSGIGYWGGLEIRILWVKEKYRKLGIGKQLLAEVEQQAQSIGAIISLLDTFDSKPRIFI